MAKCIICGKSGMLLKLDSNHRCIKCQLKATSDELVDLRSKLTPAMLDSFALDSQIQNQKALLETDHKNLAQIKLNISEQQKTLNALKKQIIVAEDTIELESFSLYRPRFAFVNAAEYKAQIDIIRDKQKAMIKAETAASCSTNWTVNGSAAQGRKMSKDTAKVILRSFNNECDIAVDAVRFNNFERCQERIVKSFDTLNKLGQVNQIAISRSYLNLKNEELHLALEYQRKKEEEREALRALKEQQREEAKLAKEIEEARKEAEKEKKHYLQAIEKLHQQIAACENDAERVNLFAKQDELVNHLDDINVKLEDIDYRQANQKAGYVYIISNIGAFGENVFKIGMTRRLDPMERIFELGDASVPFLFDVHAMIFSDDAPKLEASLHRAFETKRINLVNNRREYFNVTLDEVKNVVFANHDKTVEFFDEPEAQQYRESLRMRVQYK